MHLADEINRFREHKIAPCAGGWLDQPPVFCEAFDLLASELRTIERETQEGSK